MLYLQCSSTRDLHLNVIISKGHKSHAFRVLPQGAKIAPSAEWHVALSIQGPALRYTFGGEMFQKRLEHEGAAAYEPGVDLENPMKRQSENEVEN